MHEWLPVAYEEGLLLEFTILLIHVLHVSHPAVLEGSTRYAREMVDRFFSEHTRIDVSYYEPHTSFAI
jgi:hypothetical protein